MFNADAATITFVLPAASRQKPWRLAADTSRAAPCDCYAPGEEVALGNQTSYVTESRSIEDRVNASTRLSPGRRTVTPETPVSEALEIIGRDDINDRKGHVHRPAFSITSVLQERDADTAGSTPFR